MVVELSLLRSKGRLGAAGAAVGSRSGRAAELLGWYWGRSGKVQTR